MRPKNVTKSTFIKGKKTFVGGGSRERVTCEKGKRGGGLRWGGGGGWEGEFSGKQKKLLLTRV